MIRAPRVSIAGAMRLVLVAAVGISAMMRPSPLWAGLFVAGTLAMLTYALIGVLHARGPHRAYWSGFAVAGWMALAVHYGPWFREAVTPMLGTTALSDMAYQLLHATRFHNSIDPSAVADTPTGYTQVTEGPGTSITTATHSLGPGFPSMPAPTVGRSQARSPRRTGRSPCPPPPPP